MRNCSAVSTFNPNLVCGLRTESGLGRDGDDGAVNIADCGEGVVHGAELAQIAVKQLKAPRAFAGHDADFVLDLDELRIASVARSSIASPRGQPAR